MVLNVRWSLTTGKINMIFEECASKMKVQFLFLWDFVSPYIGTPLYHTEHTRDNIHLTFMGDLWAVCYGCIGQNWLCCKHRLDFANYHDVFVLHTTTIFILIMLSFFLFMISNITRAIAIMLIQQFTTKREINWKIYIQLCNCGCKSWQLVVNTIENTKQAPTLMYMKTLTCKLHSCNIKACY